MGGSKVHEFKELEGNFLASDFETFEKNFRKQKLLSNFKILIAAFEDFSQKKFQAALLSIYLSSTLELSKQYITNVCTKTGQITSIPNFNIDQENPSENHFNIIDVFVLEHVRN